MDRTALQGENLIPITITGMGIWYAERKELAASAELKCGSGTILFDQLRTAEFIPSEPRALIYFSSQLEYLLK